MVVTSYPGVYVEEVPSGVHAISGVATSVTAFVGRAARGPVDEPVLIEGYANYERYFGGLSPLSSMSFAVRDFFLNGGGQAIVVRLHNRASTASYAAPTSDPAASVLLEAASPGTWGNALTLSVDLGTRDASAASRQFNLTVMDQATGSIEKHLNLSVDPADSRFYPAVLAQQSAFVRARTDAAGRHVMARPVATNESHPVAVTNGADGDALTSAQFIGGGSLEGKRGLYALEKTDLFNLLCIPPYRATGGEENADVDPAVVGAAAAYCESRRSFLIVDPPRDWGSKQDAKTGFADPTDRVGTRSKNAALFFPRVCQPNPLQQNRLESFAPCGVVAGIIARTDTQRGVWKAPAGVDAVLNGVTQLGVRLTDLENGELNQVGINCLRAFPGAGRVVWGARTLQGADALASEWKYIPVRRLALYIEESLYRGTQWAVFEPNDEPLWGQLRLNVGAFMQSLFQQGALQGTSPKEAYFVKCDRETNTSNDVGRGIVNVMVGFAPLKPAEFVVLRIQQMAGQVNA